MKRKLIYLVAGILISMNVFGQAKEIIFEKITEKLYKVYYHRTTYTTNMLVSVGEDGLLLVDTGQEEEAEILKKAITDKWNQLPKIILITHDHLDHTGGNKVFGKESTIIAHKMVRKNLSSGDYIFEEFPEYFLPDITFTDSMSIYFNGEEIKLTSITGSHSDNDVIVWFTKSNVICIGDLAYKQNFPSYSDPRGVMKFSGIVQHLIDILPDDITIVTGHYDNMKKKDLSEFKDMIDKTIPVVQAGLDSGKSPEDLKKEKVLSKWDHFGNGYMDTNAWIESIKLALDNEEIKKLISEELYKVYKTGNFQNIEKKYFELKKNNYDEYFWGEGILFGIGNTLINKKKFKEAIVFIQLEIKEFPESVYGYYNHYLLGKSYTGLGDNKKALEEYKKGLKLSPENKTLKKLVAELESKS